MLFASFALYPVMTLAFILHNTYLNHLPSLTLQCLYLSALDSCSGIPGNEHTNFLANCAYDTLPISPLHTINARVLFKDCKPIIQPLAPTLKQIRSHMLSQISYCFLFPIFSFSFTMQHYFSSFSMLCP
jgi:hypothetical protein